MTNGTNFTEAELKDAIARWNAHSTRERRRRLQLLLSLTLCSLAILTLVVFLVLYLG